jgi:hypothetical protein
MSQTTRQNWRVKVFAGLLGLGVGLILVGFFLLFDNQTYLASGPLNTGHETLACSSCHDASQGTIRQQIQSISYNVLQQQEITSPLGYEPVDNENCLACHARPNDRHPVYRFVEPRFESARAAIHPQFCISCHTEHTGTRVSIEPTYCVNCHHDTEVANDPIDTSHAELIANERWGTCLGCHDFHGNHIMETPLTMSDAYSTDAILAYFAGEIQLYSIERYYSALTEVNNDE